MGLQHRKVLSEAHLGPLLSLITEECKSNLCTHTIFNSNKQAILFYKSGVVNSTLSFQMVSILPTIVVQSVK